MRSNKGPVHQNLTFRPGDQTVSEGRRDVTWLFVYLLIVPVWRSWQRLCCSAETFLFISSPRSSPRPTWWGNTNASLCAEVSWSVWSSYPQCVFVSSRTLWRSSGQRPAWWSPPHTTPKKTMDTRWCHESIHLVVAGQVTGIIIMFSDCLFHCCEHSVSRTLEVQMFTMTPEWTDQSSLCDTRWFR